MLNTDLEGSIDFEDLVARFTVDTASEFLFGENLDTLSYGQDGFGSFTNAFVAIQEQISTRNILGSIWPFFELFEDKCEKHKRVIRGWVDPLVARAVRIQKEMEKKGQTMDPKYSTFLEYLATTTQGARVPSSCFSEGS